ncbi:unnamed protein product [Rotaria magnacalcarata]|uniref:Uncharacterized protein n=2 Tax=Rotaria magnacalcarata TaxID=392030 RepID=A0A819J4G8_9BILA|nr:unnamed protein product [Rotaria magnacalcarata]CAF2116644.1 unnamed protein product [Rotaria magnacalcarata]CAF3811569.1 unnamed protein product [Rotaria magnacalcarata]CAF3923185.1 unnamed protein product [Rotaria magnacalcarata]
MMNVDQIPILPETQTIEPMVQCGVLYLGTTPSNIDFGGLDAVQEPFSYRYPVDGTNTVQGIDAVLSVYDNGIQLTFTRQPHAAIFFPITSLIYCASLRFSVINNDQTKSVPMVDWRFTPLDSLVESESRHPPLFSLIVRRTQLLPGDECHCFITKNGDSAFSLIQAVSRVYANINPGAQCLKSPIFYQLDRFGRKLTETNGVIYISPANDDDSQLNRPGSNRLTDESLGRRYLCNPKFGGYFYRTDASIIEPWQLWGDDSSTETRPRPPASPFGLHEGLYHDDTTHEIQTYLRHMDDEEKSSSYTCSSKSCSSLSSSSAQHSCKRSQCRSYKQKSSDDTDQFEESSSNGQASSFEPISTSKNSRVREKRKPPIVIEKVVPTVPSSIPILNPFLPQQPWDISNCEQESTAGSLSKSDVPSFSYRINEHGEKITKEGNRIVFMDVFRPNTNNNTIDLQSYRSSKSRSRSRRQPKHIPVIDIQSVQQFIDEKHSKNQRHTSIISDKSVDRANDTTPRLKTKDMIEIIDEYFKDYNGHKTNLSNHEIQSIDDHVKSPNAQKPRRTASIISSTNSSTNRSLHRRSHSAANAGVKVNYVGRSTISSTSSMVKPIVPVVSDEKINEYVSNTYGTNRSITSKTSSKKREESIPSNIPTTLNPTYIPAFRYMQSSANSNLVREYYNAY